MRGDGRIFTRNGSRFFWIAYYHHGKQLRQPAKHVRTGKKLEAIEDNRKDAEKFLRHRLNEIAAEQLGGQQFVGPQQERVLVSCGRTQWEPTDADKKACECLCCALYADYRLRDKDTPQFRAHLKPIAQYFGRRRAVQVTTEAVDKYISECLETKSPATVNRRTQLLAQAYKLAQERRRISLVPMVRHLSESGNARQGFFGDKDFRTVANSLPEYLRDLATFAYLTGWRAGEVAKLEWSDVDGETIRLRAENAKNGEARSVTVDGELADLIERRRKAKTVKTKEGATIARLVFHHNGQAIVDYRKAWRSACLLNGQAALYCRDLSRRAREFHFGSGR